jgi:hypothetical protein
MLPLSVPAVGYFTLLDGFGEKRDRFIKLSILIESVVVFVLNIFVVLGVYLGFVLSIFIIAGGVSSVMTKKNKVVYWTIRLIVGGGFLGLAIYLISENMKVINLEEQLYNATGNEQFLRIKEMLELEIYIYTFIYAAITVSTIYATDIFIEYKHIKSLYKRNIYILLTEIFVSLILFFILRYILSRSDAYQIGDTISKIYCLILISLVCFYRCQYSKFEKKQAQSLKEKQVVVTALQKESGFQPESPEQQTEINDTQ